MNDMPKIVFMGTPEFAVPCLEFLYKNNYNICRVVTQPDRPKGRGRKMLPPPVKEAATGFGLDVVQPESIQSDAFLENIAELKPDFFVVVAYGQVLTEERLAIPTVAPVSGHASLLPKYRGAAPIQWAVIDNEKETGVTTMLMDKGLDTGDILLTTKEKILPEDTAATLHDRLAKLGADLLKKTLQGMTDGTVKPIPQNNNLSTYAPILKKKDGHINWDLPAEKLNAFVRGMSPWPGAFTFLENNRVKIFCVKPEVSDDKMQPGTVIRGFPDELRVAVKDGAVSILEIQGASGKRLLIRDFLRGCSVPPGTVLS